LGNEVRYDGGHKRDNYLVNTLGQHVDWVPVCPEVEIGLPVPRETLRLIGDPDDPVLIAPKSGTEYTRKMREWASTRLDELAEIGIHGFVFKKDSPSSGLFRVRVYDAAGVPQRVGTGIFPREVTKRFPLLPVEEEGRLNDMILRESFIERVFVYYRLTRLLEENPTPGGIVQFHTAHKLTMMAHSPQHYQEMGRLVAQSGSLPWEDLSEPYAGMLMEGLAVHGTPGKHTNVMQHLMGFLKDTLDADDKSEMLGLLEDYRQGLLPLIVPLTLLKHHLNRHDVPDWVHQQVYLNPYPKELMLRNHV
jgi:uncharacterized protein YbgA (DUF1722 family)/uncharacterized protein YbbK (DUF523 family)